MMVIILFLLLAIILFAVIQYSFLVPPVKGLPVLMYHLIDDTLPPDGMNVTPTQFSEQLNYLKTNNY